MNYSWLPEVVNSNDIGQSYVIECMFSDAPKSLRNGFLVISPQEVIFYRLKVFQNEIKRQSRQTVVSLVEFDDEMSRNIATAVSIQIEFSNQQIWQIRAILQEEMQTVQSLLSVLPDSNSGPQMASAGSQSPHVGQYEGERQHASSSGDNQDVRHSLSNQSNLLTANEGGDTWQGKTVLTGGVEAIVKEIERLAQQAHDPVIILHLQGWVERLELEGPRGRNHPPEGYYVPPLPLPMPIASSLTQSPVGALSPWWPHFALPDEMPELVAHSPRFEDLISAFRYLGSRDFHYDTMLDYCDPLSAHIGVDHSKILIWSQARIDRERISRAGTVSSLLFPTYGALRQATAMLSSQQTTIPYGCQIPLESIAGLHLTLTHSNLPPVMATQTTKAFYQNRGFGHCYKVRFQIETSDSWKQDFFTLCLPKVSLEIENSLIEFYFWLGQWVAYFQAKNLLLSSDEQSRLEAVIAGQEPIESRVEDQEAGAVVRSWNLTFPWHRSISVRLV